MNIDSDHAPLRSMGCAIFNLYCSFDTSLRITAMGLLAIFVLLGCETVHPPELDTNSVASQAAGLTEPIAFRTEGGTVNDPDEPNKLTLAEAVRKAVMTDPGVQSALARVRIALADAKQARLLPNPILNLALRFPESGGSPVFEASLAQDLISILRIPRQSSAADNRLRITSAFAVTTTIDVVAQVMERYVTAQALEQLLPVLAERQALLGKLIELTQARLNAGEGTREDVAVLEAQRVEFEVEVAQKAQELRDERLRLARLIGHPSGLANWQLESWEPPFPTDFSQQTWIEASLQHRPEIQAVVWKLAALGDDLALAKLLPFDGLSAGVQAQRDGQWATGPEVSIPIPVFDMGQAKTERVTAEQIEARHELVQSKRLVIEEVRRALQTLASTRDNLRRVREELIPLQQRRYHLAEAAFKAGQSDVTTLFLAEQDLRAAQAKAVDLNRQVSIAVIGLHRAVGRSGNAAQLNVTKNQPKHAAVITNK